MQFALTGAQFKEIAAAIKPHVATGKRADHNPIISGIRVRFNANARQAAFDATDGYSAIRALAIPDDALLTPGRDDFDVTVPGPEFLSLKPDKAATVTFTVKTPPAPFKEKSKDGWNVGGTQGYSDVTDGVTTVKLEHLIPTNRYPGEFPDLDKLMEPHATFVPPDGFRLGPEVISRLGKLPSAVDLRATLEGGPILFACNGRGSDDYSAPEYQGALMPIRRVDEDGVMVGGTSLPEWQAWT